MDTLAAMDWVELVSAIGELWRLVGVAAAVLALFVLRRELARIVDRLTRLCFAIGATRVQVDCHNEEANAIESRHAQEEDPLMESVRNARPLR